MKICQSERGQALAETALFAVLAILMAFGLLAWIPAHRARTAATSAAYACSQFLSQSPDPAPDGRFGTVQSHFELVN
jgi:hypothetical protein